MHTRTIVALALIAVASACGEAEAPAPPAEGDVDSVGLTEGEPTDCVDPTNPACIREPRPAAVEALREGEGTSAHLGREGSQERPPAAEPEPELSTVSSEAGLEATAAQVADALAGAGLDVVATVDYEARGRGGAETAASAAALEGATGTERPEAIGDIRMIVFRSAGGENRAIAERGVAALFDAPRTIAVFERGEGVAVAWRRPADAARDAEGEPLGPQLARVIAEAVVDRSEASRSASAG